jgi:hypothetical protein
VPEPRLEQALAETEHVGPQPRPGAVDAKKKRFHTFCQDDRWGAAARVGKTTIIIASFKVSPDQVILATQNLARLAPPRTGRQLSPPLPSTTEGAARAGGWVPRKRVFCLTVRGA